MSSSFNALRYLRHVDLPALGFAGQEKICAGSVLIVGMGGLGAPAGLYLAGGGVGHIGLVDDDAVEESNLQRQVVFTQTDVGTPKVMAAQARLSALNPTIKISAHHLRLNESNATSLCTPYDVILDCSDNFATRFLLNDVAIHLKKPLLSASVQGFAGQIGVFKGHEKNHACYRCLFPETPPKGMVPSCPEAGVYGPIVGLMGTWQAAEAMKELAGLTSHETPFISIDLLTGSMNKMAVSKNLSCVSCGKHT